MRNLNEELENFYQKNGFGPLIGKRPLTVKVYTGCLLVPMPNIETRNKYLKYHDLHHLITGYSVGRIGEGEVSAWELGTGSFLKNPVLGVMNLIALSTGLVLDRNRMWQAYLRGSASHNIYSSTDRKDVGTGKWQSLEEIKSYCLPAEIPNNVNILRRIEFYIYIIVAAIIHAVIAIPAVVLRLITDIGMGKSFFEAVKSKKRADLY